MLECTENEIIGAQQTIHRLLDILEKNKESKKNKEKKKDFVNTPVKVKKRTEEAVTGAKVSMTNHQMMKYLTMNPQQIMVMNPRSNIGARGWSQGCYR